VNLMESLYEENKQRLPPLVYERLHDEV
jgi:hypothetical protein